MTSKLPRARYQEYGGRPNKGYSMKKLLNRSLESFFDSCAAYNLRYVSYRTTDNKACLTNTVKDIFMLFCFFVANFVVLLIIVSRITVRVGGLMVVAFDYARQTLNESGITAPQLKTSKGRFQTARNRGKF